MPKYKIEIDVEIPKGMQWTGLFKEGENSIIDIISTRLKNCIEVSGFNIKVESIKHGKAVR